MNAPLHTRNQNMQENGWMDDMLFDAIMDNCNQEAGGRSSSTSIKSMEPIPKLAGCGAESRTMVDQEQKPEAICEPIQLSSSAISVDLTVSQSAEANWKNCTGTGSNNAKLCSLPDSSPQCCRPQENVGPGSNQSITVTLSINSRLKTMIESGEYVMQFRFVPSETSKIKTLKTSAERELLEDTAESSVSTPASCLTNTGQEHFPEDVEATSLSTDDSDIQEGVEGTANQPLQQKHSTHLVGPTESSVPIDGVNRGGYMDYSGVPENKQALPMMERNLGGVTRPFPERLFHMLTEEKFPDVVAWAPHGRAFHIKHSKEFELHVLPKYFNQTKYRSFQRQLNLYGFRRLHQDLDRGAYYHELFLKGRPNLCSP
jgi:hypothetical protein